GTLGWRALVRVADLMLTGDSIPVVSQAMPLREVIVEMTKKRKGVTTVVDAAGRLAGVITDGDLRRLHLRGTPIDVLCAGEVAAVFVIGVAGTLVAKSRTVRVEPAGPAASSADLHIKEVELEEVSGGVRWRLKAEQALVFEPQGRTALRKIAVNVFERDRSWTMVGEEGDLFQA